MSALHSIGITHSMLILAVLALVAAGVIGMFWHIIVPGAIIVLVGTLFINFTPSVETVETPNKVQPVKFQKTVETDERQEYMKDCMTMAQYPMAKCAAMWDNREDDEPVVTKSKVDKVDVSELQLLDVDNTEYKARRDEALKKPGAVVGHVTYR